MERTTGSHRVPDAGASSAVSESATLSGTIYSRVRSDVLNGRRAPGSRVRLEELKGEFGVSWSPIREAVSRLVAEGLIISEEQRSYRVVQVSRADFAEALHLRVLLETMALRASIDKGDDAWEAEVLAAHHRLMKLEATRDGTAGSDEWERWHGAFHESLTRAGESPNLLQFCRMLHAKHDRYRRVFLASNSFDRNVAAEHKALASTALARDADKACALLKSHIERTGRNILRAMRG